MSKNGASATSSCSASSLSGGCSASGSCARLTINGGIGCLNPDDTLIVGSGTYDEQISDSGFNPGYSGTAPPSGSGAGAFTILRAETKWGVVVRAARNGGSQYNVILNAPTTHHIRLEGLLIDGEHGVAGMEACLGTYRSHDLQFIDVACKHHVGGGWLGLVPTCCFNVSGFTGWAGA